ncbi:MAG: helix-hairpin-helix domain-containing protein [Candidatus Margulisbacteria bacterium]|nr:helix-hairpin-helix domain-containing protein [Candidatus Margulisiibacteriota bacterium]
MELNLSKEQQLIILGLIASIVIGLAVMAVRQFIPDPNEQKMIEQPKMDRQTTGLSVTVHICGAVRREGVYKLKPGDRLMEVVALAGGAQPLADLSAVNLAEPVKDGAKIVIPAKQISVPSETKPGSFDEKRSRKSPTAAVGPTVKVNLNTADEKTLDSLPGVGPSTAKTIVEYRRTNGTFSKIEQIMEIPRFGKSKFERIKNMIVI